MADSLIEISKEVDVLEDNIDSLEKKLENINNEISQSKVEYKKANEAYHSAKQKFKDIYIEINKKAKEFRQEHDIPSSFRFGRGQRDKVPHTQLFDFDGAIYKIGTSVEIIDGRAQVIKPVNLDELPKVKQEVNAIKEFTLETDEAPEILSSMNEQLKQGKITYDLLQESDGLKDKLNELNIQRKEYLEDSKKLKRRKKKLLNQREIIEGEITEFMEIYSHISDDQMLHKRSLQYCQAAALTVLSKAKENCKNKHDCLEKEYSSLEKELLDVKSQTDKSSELTKNYAETSINIAEQAFDLLARLGFNHETTTMDDIKNLRNELLKPIEGKEVTDKELVKRIYLFKKSAEVKVKPDHAYDFIKGLCLLYSTGLFSCIHNRNLLISKEKEIAIKLSDLKEQIDTFQNIQTTLLESYMTDTTI